MQFPARTAAALLPLLVLSLNICFCVDAWSVTDAARAPFANVVTPWSLLHRCRLRPNPAEYLATILSEKFVGQAEAIAAVVDAVKAWNDEYVVTVSQPLRVL